MHAFLLFYSFSRVLDDERLTAQACYHRLSNYLPPILRLGFLPPSLSGLSSLGHWQLGRRAVRLHNNIQDNEVAASENYEPLEQDSMKGCQAKYRRSKTWFSRTLLAHVYNSAKSSERTRTILTIDQLSDGDSYATYSACKLPTCPLPLFHHFALVGALCLSADYSPYAHVSSSTTTRTSFVRCAKANGYCEKKKGED
ncbi:hypothetical protein A7U60_g997 [Sanghuangporus baumii]|uniref:Uncharacterized protein n=1 Tax=Sanghuangporus baumii TaxID=108892 RepID=A0A9Q5N9M1_SANBA|nr:hypothetical protein A7U60_g997 [Sanghuangporus baumii]